ncbi:hypothetical protein F5Y00DRAFT_226154 [Daldinia vernicosa]|uniref:uncharacterized protein n=1 Tax=Daldinia vernicosa TaxID=114800 RepID=UPI0020084F73|nr:uncharacterized protein F5Y00DRAFT_226154 [Daldinia vernicosa]KAI0852817.1 hypothetical protein F5Y00DRAFT_226154 [Daldinia vernicosa]
MDQDQDQNQQIQVMDQDQDQNQQLDVTDPQEELREWSPPFFDFGFNITKQGLACVPQELLDAECSKLYIEFLLQFLEPETEGPESEKIPVTAHTVLKADFMTPLGHYKGVRIAMDLDRQALCEESGVLGVKFRTYSGKTTSSIRTFAFPVIGSVTIGQMLETMTSKKMEHFEFDYDDDDHIHGCSDFM